jgi:hypothetical protein
VCVCVRVCMCSLQPLNELNSLDELQIRQLICDSFPKMLFIFVVDFYCF